MRLPWRAIRRRSAMSSAIRTVGLRDRLFAAEMALQSYALLAAAEGAVAAYADITGEDWKPYEAPVAPAASVERKSAAVEMAAFETA